MKSKEELILDAITLLSNKVDDISSMMGFRADNRLDNETIAVISAVAFSLFGKKVAIHSVKLLK